MPSPPPHPFPTKGNDIAASPRHVNETSGVARGKSASVGIAVVKGTAETSGGIVVSSVEVGGEGYVGKGGSEMK